MYVLILIIIVYYILSDKKEHFYGMNYIQQHNYLKCCYNLGCNNEICKKYISVNKKARKLYIGNLYLNYNSRLLFNKYNNKNLKLYMKQKNGKDIYYIQFENKKNKKVYNKLNTNDKLSNRSIIKLNESIYTTKLNDENKYNPLYRNNYFKYEDSIYPVSPYAKKYGYLKPDELNSTIFLSLYRRQNSIESWNYYVKKDDKLIELSEYKNKILTNGEKINFLEYDKTNKYYTVSTQVS